SPWKRAKQSLFRLPRRSRAGTGDSLTFVKIGEGNFLAFGLIVLRFGRLRFQRTLHLRVEGRKKSGDGRTALAQRFQGDNNHKSSDDSTRQPKLIEKSEQRVSA